VLLGFVTFLLFKVRSIGELLSGRLAFSKPAGAANQPPLLPVARARPVGMPSVGIREEAEARRRAEERADAAEKRATTLQDKYRKTLEDLQEAQHDLRAKPGNSRILPALEERALKAEGRARTLEAQIQAIQSEREKLAEDLNEAIGAKGAESSTTNEELERLLQTEQDSIGLRAELEGARTQLSILGREVEQARSDPGREGLQEELDSAHVQSLRSREAAETAMAELKTARVELTELREEARGLRNQEQKAAMLEDELRAARAEIEGLSVAPTHGQEAATELEDKVRAVREEFQRELASAETRYRDQFAQRDVELADKVAAAEMKSRDSGSELETTRKALEEALEEAAGARDRLIRQADQHAATAAEFESMRAELIQRQERLDKAGDQARSAEEQAQTASAKLEKTRTDLLAAREQLEAQKARADELSTALAISDEEAKAANQLAAGLKTQFDGAAHSNAELNQRMQELQSRRALELAGTDGKADLDEILRVTQERLAGQTEKLIHAEERVHELERDVTTLSHHNEEIESALRQRQMSGAMKQLRGEAEPQAPVLSIADTGAPQHQEASQGPRTPSPFVLELSMDAKKSLTRIMGVTQVLKHKREAKDQTTLIKQLTAYTRHLDHTVSDLMDAERLATGTVEINIKRTDLKALVSRVIDESGVGSDHEVNMELESLVVGIDQRRTEQILSAMLRTCADRTAEGKTLTVKLSRVDGGALLFVEDGQPSKEAVLSPVVQRFAEVQGGWARVEALETGGTSFRVYLPDGGPDQIMAEADQNQNGTHTNGKNEARNLHVVEEPWDNSGEKLLVGELQRLSQLEPQKGRKR
jgi:chromosome segregation ATPase